MLDVGFSELFVFGIIALLVLGPEKLPEAARFAARCYSKFKTLISNVQNDIDRELRLSELREQMNAEMQRIQALEQKMQAQMQELQQQTTQAAGQQQQHAATDNNKSSFIYHYQPTPVALLLNKNAWNNNAQLQQAHTHSTQVMSPSNISPALTDEPPQQISSSSEDQPHDHSASHVESQHEEQKVAHYKVAV